MGEATWPLIGWLQGKPPPPDGGHSRPRSLAPSCRGHSTHLDIFLRFLSSALAFWAEVRLSASARLSTAMARKTLSRMSESRAKEPWVGVKGSLCLGWQDLMPAGVVECPR